MGAQVNLSVSSLFFELAIIFLPGFVWMKIHVKYGANKERSQFDLILNAFLFGVVSYIILMTVYKFVGSELNVLGIDQNATKLLDSKILPEVAYATSISVICGFIFVYLENRKAITFIVQSLGISKRFGDEDVWDFVFNSGSQDVTWVYFRDFEQSVVYSGYVGLFSESGQLRELLLQDVIVYDFDGNELYQVPRLYLARDRDNIHIEFPKAERTFDGKAE